MAESTPGPDAPLPAPLLGLAYLLFAVAGALLGAFCVLLIPLRAGTTLLPVAPVLAVLAGVLLPAVARGLTDTLRSTAPPVIGQVLGIWALSMGRPEGDVLMPAGATEAVSYAVLILGTLAPLFVLGLSSRPGRWSLASFRSGVFGSGRGTGTRPGLSTGSEQAAGRDQAAGPGLRSGSRPRPGSRSAGSGTDSDGAR